ncbi:hypothetical protein [Macrococcus animalis]|uniref:hypothetical protein n=1 Tax=Macrococcus animalis TaxID=3395467 RepID=UPI0039BE824D
MFSILQKFSDVQWIWGALSGFPSEMSWEEIKAGSVEYDITENLDFLHNGISHLESKAVFELIAIDSSETIVVIDDEDVSTELLKHFSKYEEY